MGPKDPWQAPDEDSRIVDAECGVDAVCGGCRSGPRLKFNCGGRGSSQNESKQFLHIEVVGV